MTKTTKSSGQWRRMTASEGEALVRQWRESGLSMQEFCRRRGIGAHRVRYWSQRLPKKAESKGVEPEPFVVLPADELGHASGADSEVAEADDAIEIFVGEQYFVRVPPKSGSLAEVLKALQEVAA